MGKFLITLITGLMVSCLLTTVSAENPTGYNGCKLMRINSNIYLFSYDGSCYNIMDKESYRSIACNIFLPADGLLTWGMAGCNYFHFYYKQKQVIAVITTNFETTGDSMKTMLLSETKIPDPFSIQNEPDYIYVPNEREINGIKDLTDCYHKKKMDLYEWKMAPDRPDRINRAIRYEGYTVYLLNIKPKNMQKFEQAVSNEQ